jgi:hypothetical protein
MIKESIPITTHHHRTTPTLLPGAGVGRGSGRFAGPCTTGLSRVLLLCGYEELRLTLVGAASLADHVSWNPMFGYGAPAVIEPS